MTTLRADVELPLDPAAAFAVVVDELASALAGLGIELEAALDGRVREGPKEIGRVTAWRPPERVAIEWRQADWEPGEITQVELRFERIEAGTRVIVEHHGWGQLLGDAAEAAAWFARQTAAPLLRATAPAALGDWLTDRQARRPSGARAREVYRAPLYHYPNFAVILAELALTPADYLLEVGCGGGVLLEKALAGGCRAAAVDHSLDMVRLARQVNAEAIARGRLHIVRADAHALPFTDAAFTCAAMTGVLGFLRDPVRALTEMRRVLAPGGRIVVLGSDPELRGTPGAPEPMASRLRFYEDDELAALGRAAGFDRVEAVRRDLEPFAREAGVPEEHLPLFSGPGTRFLLGNR